jgi:hypothetical protein
MTYGRYAIQRSMPMTAETSIAVLVLVGIFIAVGAQVFRISAWRLFGAGCVPAAIVVAVSAWVLSTPCGPTENQGPRALGVLILICLGLSLVLYAGAAVAGVIDGLRAGKAGRSASALGYFVLCPVVSVIGGGVVLYAAIGTFFHCFEL